MIEHRLIEKMIAVIKKEIERGEQEKKINPELLQPGRKRGHAGGRI
jgi:hypothetical protein